MFLTGEFSKIGRVSKRSLQYYDEIGLLKPAHTDPETGYRYYSADQLPRLNRILALKGLGLTLKQIAQMLNDNVIDDEIHGMLMMQKMQLEQRVRADLNRLRRIEARLQQSRTDLPDVVLKEVQAKQVLSVEHLCLNPEDGLHFIGHLMRYLPQKVNRDKLGHFVALSDNDGFEDENIDLEFGFFVNEPVSESITISGDITLTTRKLPAVTMMATAVHVGDIYQSSVAYGALGYWIENNGYQIVGQQREIFIELPKHADDRNVVLEIQFPIEKINRSDLLPST